MRFGHIQQWVQVENPVPREKIRLLGESGPYHFRRESRGRAGIAGPDVDQRGAEHVEHRKEDAVDRILFVLFEEEIVNMSQSELGRITGIDGTALGSHPEHLLGCKVRKNQVARR